MFEDVICEMEAILSREDELNHAENYCDNEWTGSFLGSSSWITSVPHNITYMHSEKYDTMYFESWWNIGKSQFLYRTL